MTVASDRPHTKQIERPLSPHLQIYRWQLTMLMSISHRITGGALVGGTMLLSATIIALAFGAEIYPSIQAIFSSPFGQILLLGWTLSLYYHLFNGIRHLFWDVGYGFSLRATYRSGYLVLAASVVLTILTWLTAFQIIPLKL